MSEYEEDYGWGDDDRPFVKIIKCKFCDEEGLHWEEPGGKWRLYNSKGEQHVCTKGIIHDSVERRKEKFKGLTVKEKSDIMSITVEQVEGGCIIHDTYGYIVIIEPYDVLEILEKLTSYLEENYRTLWYLLPGVRAMQKLEEIGIFLKMCKDKVSKKDMLKVME